MIVVLISYLDYPYNAGLSKRIDGFVKVLISNGIKVKIIAPIARNDLIPKDDFSPNLSIHRIDLGYFKFMDSRFSGKFIQWLLFSFKASFLAMRYFIKTHCMVQYQSIYSLLPALAAKFFLRATIIGDDIVLINPFIDMLAMKFTDLVITPSLKTYSFACRIQKSTLYVPNGIQQTQHKRSSSDPNHIILFVGSLSFDQNTKAVENIIKIASILKEKGVIFEILVVGGPLSGVKRLLSSKEVKNGSVKFLGTVTDDKLEDLYSSSYIGLLPFFQDTPLLGGQRIKALEFFAHSLLVISGPEGVKGISNLKSGKDYLLANSIEEMSTMIEKCFSENDKYLIIANSGANYISENYSWKNLTKNYVNVILRLNNCL